MEKITVRAADGASVQMTAQGARLFVDTGRWSGTIVSEQNQRMARRRCIRGGVPVIFPQFGGLENLPSTALPTSHWTPQSCNNDAQGKGIAVFVPAGLANQAVLCGRRLRRSCA
jgi:D-hexose-6-phosphate mutarotase